METSEENLSAKIGKNPLQDGSIEPIIAKSRFVKILVRTGAILLMILVFIFFISVLFMSHTYSYHL